MNPQIRHAQRACEVAKARQAVVVWFDEHGQHAVASYGETKAECTAVNRDTLRKSKEAERAYRERRAESLAEVKEIGAKMRGEP